MISDYLGRLTAREVVEEVAVPRQGAVLAAVEHLGESVVDAAVKVGRLVVGSRKRQVGTA